MDALQGGGGGDDRRDKRRVMVGELDAFQNDVPPEGFDDAVRAFRGGGERLVDAVEFRIDVQVGVERVHGIDAADGFPHAQMLGDHARQNVGGLVSGDGEQHVRLPDACLLHDFDVRGVPRERHDVQFFMDACKTLLGDVDDRHVVSRAAEPFRQQLPEFTCAYDDDFHILMPFGRIW